MKRRHYSPTDIHLPPLPTESERRATLVMARGDAALVRRALLWSADRCEGTAARMRDMAPELSLRASRLRRIAATIEAQTEAVR